MNVKQSIKLYIKVFCMFLFITFLFNVIGLLFHLVKSNFVINQFIFKNGYFILNNETIGTDLFSNLLKTSITSLLLTIYMIYRNKKKEAF
jgi:hypothetical protein